MTNVILLKAKIDESGLKTAFIAKECGLSTQYEIAVLKKLLDLTNDEAETIFFSLTK